jgi:hypothetical protein
MHAAAGRIAHACCHKTMLVLQNEALAKCFIAGIALGNGIRSERADDTVELPSRRATRHRFADGHCQRIGNAARQFLDEATARKAENTAP